MTFPNSNQALIDSRTVFAERARKVGFQEVDAAGTIYFARVFEYFSDTYLDLLTAAGLDVPAMLRSRSLAAPLAHAEADFVKPLFFGDPVVCEIVAAETRTSGVSFGHRIRRPNGEVCATGRTVHVFVEGKTFQKTALPAALVSYLDARRAGAPVAG